MATKEELHQAYLKQQALIQRLDANREKREAPQASASASIYPHLKPAMTQRPLGHRVVESKVVPTWKR
jgi:hypothetical protein